ncbi:pantoate--beta-alanine ligase [Oceanobacillus senegalensis]|uniref:pantoate--beta-alanine ligase n=1 Tax=Oceanobacillus senegalensis TaxID=1936063 RepID=UPI000A306E52|nr:pantoate--beta-alanine ligase [Oceanobacillus senegalensis]
MKIIHTVHEMQKISLEINSQQRQIGFVPTMGYFHGGHLQLMKEARKENEIVVTSIFVNPLQFGPNEDYEKYPRDVKKDISDAEKAGVDILFVPDAKEMYPNLMKIQMKIKDRTDVLCGRSRPGHFDGVITVLTKLFHIVSPHRAYFGLKDAQQLSVVDALIRDLNFPIKLMGVPTVREEDGLAKSSRNVFLTEKERNEATWLYKALKEGQQLINKGENNPEKIVHRVLDILENNTSGKIDYVELLSYPELKPLSIIDQQVIIAVAVHFEHARLIDNLIVDKDGVDNNLALLE